MVSSVPQYAIRVWHETQISETQISIEGKGYTQLSSFQQGVVWLITDLLLYHLLSLLQDLIKYVEHLPVRQSPPLVATRHHCLPSFSMRFMGERFQFLGDPLFQQPDNQCESDKTLLIILLFFPGGLYGPHFVPSQF